MCLNLSSMPLISMTYCVSRKTLGLLTRIPLSFLPAQGSLLVLWETFINNVHWSMWWLPPEYFVSLLIMFLIWPNVVILKPESPEELIKTQIAGPYPQTQYFWVGTLEFIFLTNILVMLMLLIHRPHFERAIELMLCCFAFAFLWHSSGLPATVLIVSSQFLLVFLLCVLDVEVLWNSIPGPQYLDSVFGNLTQLID